METTESLNILSKEEVLKIYNKNTHNLTKTLEIYFPETYSYINKTYIYNYIKDKNNFSEKVYKYVYGDNMGVCELCKKNKTKFLNFNRGYSHFCSRICQQKNTASKYGVNNLFQSEIVKNKIKKVLIERYGVDNPNKFNIFKQKSKNTKLEKYGSETYNNINKNKQTCLKRYGVTSHNKLEWVKEKIKQTCLKRYGGIGSASKIILTKIKRTNLERYGSESPMHCNDLYEKNKIAGFKLKKYIFPSGKVVKVQGYENYALDYLLSKYKEDDIVVDRKTIPKFKYELNGKFHKYYPDIFIKSENLIVETKSTWTNKLHLVIDELKKQSVINSNFGFLKLIFDAKGNLVNE